MAIVYDFEAALEQKNAAQGIVTEIRCENGEWIAEYQSLVYRGPSFDDLMMQLGWFDNVGFEDSLEVVEVVTTLIEG